MSTGVALDREDGDFWSTMRTKNGYLGRGWPFKFGPNEPWKIGMRAGEKAVTSDH